MKSQVDFYTIRAIVSLVHYCPSHLQTFLLSIVVQATFRFRYNLARLSSQTFPPSSISNFHLQHSRISFCRADSTFHFIQLNLHRRHDFSLVTCHYILTQPNIHTMNTTNMLGLALKTPLIESIKSQANTSLGGLEMWARGGSDVWLREPIMRAGLCVLTLPIIILISTKVYGHVTKQSEIPHLPATEQVRDNTETASDKPTSRGTRRGGRRGGRGRYKSKQQTPSPPRRPAFETLPVQAKVWNSFAVTAPKQYLVDADKAYEASRARKVEVKVKESDFTCKETYKCTKKTPTCEVPAPPSPSERKPTLPPHLRARLAQSNSVAET